MEYKFKEGQEEKKPEERIIEKTGHVIEFSLVEMRHDLKGFEKTLKELKGNRDLKKAVMNNLEQHHPFIKDISEFDQHTIHMYFDAFSVHKAYSSKIEEIEKQYEDYKLEIKEVEETLGIESVVSPYVDPIEPVATEHKLDNFEKTNEETNQDNQKEEGTN